MWYSSQNKDVVFFPPIVSLLSIIILASPTNLSFLSREYSFLSTPSFSSMLPSVIICTIIHIVRVCWFSQSKMLFFFLYWSKALVVCSFSTGHRRLTLCPSNKFQVDVLRYKKEVRKVEIDTSVLLSLVQLNTNFFFVFSQ